MSKWLSPQKMLDYHIVRRFGDVAEAERRPPGASGVVRAILVNSGAEAGRTEFEGHRFDSGSGAPVCSTLVHL